MKIFRRGYSREGGQSLVEFALILPILLLIIVAIVDFGWIFMAKIIVNNAAREGARHYAVNNDEDAAAQAASEAMSIITTSWVSAPTLSVRQISTETEPKAEVIISGKVKPLIGIYMGNQGVDISSKSIMRIEYNITTSYNDGPFLPG